MHKQRWFIILAAAILSAVTFSNPVQGAAASGGPDQHRKMMWANYVPWFMPGTFSSYSGMDLPLHQFSSDMNTALREDMDLALKYGVDGFLVCMSSWAGKKVLERQWVYESMLKAAEGTDFYLNRFIAHFSGTACG